MRRQVRKLTANGRDSFCSTVAPVLEIDCTPNPLIRPASTPKAGAGKRSETANCLDS
jgi:hypothetical protein